MNLSEIAVHEYPTNPMFKAVVMYDDVAVHGVKQIRYETEWMDIETFASEYPISIFSFDMLTELDSLYYGLEEEYRDPQKVTILFYSTECKGAIPYEDDPRRVYWDDLL